MIRWLNIFRGWCICHIFPNGLTFFHNEANKVFIIVEPRKVVRDNYAFIIDMSYEEIGRCAEILG